MTTTRTPASGNLTDRIRSYWDQQAPHYDRMARFEHFLIGDSRAWVCRQAHGETLEVAVGTGRNLGLYAEDVHLTGIDLSSGMLAIARRRADQLGLTPALRAADAQHLPFPDTSFDTVVCTLALCAVPDLQRTLDEMYRVLRPGGRLLLLDHVRPTFPPLLWLLRGMQWRMSRSPSSNGEQLLRRPLEEAVERGFLLDRQERFKGGAVERLVAHRPVGSNRGPRTTPSQQSGMP